MMLQGRLTGALDFNDVFPLQNPATIPILQMRKWQYVEITQLESGNTHIQNQTTCLWSPQSSPLCHAVQIKNERDRLMLNIETTSGLTPRQDTKQICFHLGLCLTLTVLKGCLV